MIVIYSKPGCAYCTRAKALLTQRGLEFEELMLGVNFNREFLLEKFPNAKTFPQIEVTGIGIGGYEELVIMLG